MTKDEILARVTDILVASFDLDRDQVRPTAHLIDALDLDSIDAIDLVVGVEEATGLKVREQEIKEIRIVQDIVDLIHRRLGEG
jgi:acyl carrier protein